MQIEQILATWKDYATIKKWKQGLKFNSHKNRLSQNTEEAINFYMPLFIKYTQKTPDELIEEALAGKHVVKERLSDFCTWLVEDMGKKYNNAVHGTYHIIRGFYSHNDINTQKIRSPKTEPSEVQFVDDEVPLFEIVEARKQDGTTEKVKKLRRDFLKNFYDGLSLRDKIIAMCIKDSGLDSGDILDLPLMLIRYTDPSQPRIFIRDLRNKTGESISTFFSIETTKLLRNYTNLHRKDAVDTEPVFVQSLREFKTNFHKKNGRPFDPQRDEVKLEPLTPTYLAMSFRIATAKLEKLLSTTEKPLRLLRSKKQSPLRPKRFRKLFSDACDDAGIPVDIKRVFMGKKDAANKPYESKSRQDLELWYEKLEPKILVYTEQQPVNENLVNEVQELRKEQQEMKAQLALALSGKLRNATEQDLAEIAKASVEGRLKKIPHDVYKKAILDEAKKLEND